MIYRFHCVSSTNDVAQDNRYQHGDIIWAKEQSAGRGQRGNKWQSDSGENLTFTVVLSPESLPLKRQFALLRVTALALVKTLAGEGIEAKIKWTNDIYVADKKICGVLIENRIEQGFVRKSIVGIGLNVNQKSFPASLPNPTSMSIEARHDFDCEEILERLHSNVMSYMNTPDLDSLHKEYLERVYRFGELHRYRHKSGEEFPAKIIDVAPTGELTLEMECGAQKSYLFGEVGFII